MCAGYGLGAILDWLAATTGFDLMCSLFFLPGDWYPSINNFIQSVTLFKFNFESKGQLTKKKDRILINDLISNKWKY